MARSPTIAVFSGIGGAHASRAQVFAQAGSFLAKKGARLMAVEGVAGLPLTTLSAARSASAEIEIVVSDVFQVPKALSEASVIRSANLEDRMRIMRERADAIAVLPGALALANDLYRATLMEPGVPPVILLNHDNAFEVLRGFVVDVFTHNHPNPDRVMQVADSLEDMWNRIQRLKLVD
ncbi:MAG: hypothetical protein KDJ19_00190 [Hyphomicrobiaceae bacterium]|nr:hypothetical protein [Hyphomicrobiaceae bacterium]MCC0023142.1 hypothetical protein [Hyphomicrobiaceae bacterium]